MSAIVYWSPATNSRLARLLVEPGESLRRLAALTLAVVGELLNAVGEERVGVAEDLHDRKGDLEFHPALPHLDAGRLLRLAAAHQRRLGLDLLEVAADGDRLGDERAVVEFEDRNATHRVHLPEGLLPVLGLAQVDRHDRDLDALLGQKDAYAAAVGGGGGFV